MRIDRPPYIGSVKIRHWLTKDKQSITGIALSGAHGLAAHLSAKDARQLADTLHDLADKLDDTPQTPQPLQVQQLVYTSYSPLTAADGTPEKPLPATIAD